jgi:hypothetical protein
MHALFVSYPQNSGFSQVRAWEAVVKASSKATARTFIVVRIQVLEIREEGIMMQWRLKQYPRMYLKCLGE